MNEARGHSLGARLRLADALVGAVEDSVSALQRLLVEVHRELGAALREESEAGRDERIDALMREVEQLREGMTSRPVIERAKGMLMQAQHLSEDEAFELLTRLSQARRRKLRDMAADIVAGSLAPHLAVVGEAVPERGTATS